ncbi:hypothetical protein LWI29_016407 [Acer saccharum]|uniref:PHL domain-containing protein n=1 Tax=Acer saccharum TaxID=4024 RepID=A0AA39VPV4_ACESA|nr:hypothetical protein LWI29_016407 [Acer saccharum]
MSVPLNANSPSVGTLPLADQIVLDRFSKIESVNMRYKLSSKKNKVDDYPIRKPRAYSAHNLSVFLSNASNNEDFKNDAWPLSKSLVGGSMNICKARVINFLRHPERIVQGSVMFHRLRSRMIASEKPRDGTVAMYYGDIEDGDILAEEDHLPTLPNTHLADLLAAQYCSLMLREGFQVEDQLQAKPMRMNNASTSQPNPTAIPPTNSGVEMQQYADAVSGQVSGEVAKPTSSGNTSLNSSQNLLAGARMLPPGNPQALQMSQGLVSGVSMPARPQQLDSQPSLQPQPQQPQQPQQPTNQHSLIQQQQQQQFQRSQMLLGANPISQLNAIGQNSNMQLNNHMVNKSSLPLQFLQQQQQQQQQQQPQQQAQMQRKIMMGLGNAGMGNMGNNMVGLGGLGNAMSMGGARGIGGTGMSAPMSPISNMGNMGQNMNLSQASNLSNAITQHIRSGKLTPQQAALVAQKFKMRTGMIGGPQSSIAGMSGPRQQMLPGSAGLSSMLGPNLSRGSNHNGAYGSDGSTKVDAGNQSLYEPAATTDSITANAAAATATATANTAAATTAVTTITADTATAIAATATAATAAAVTATATTAAAARNNLPTASSGFTFTGRLTIDHGNSTDEPTNSVTATPAKSNESTTTESKNPNEPADEFRCNPCHKYW